MSTIETLEKGSKFKGNVFKVNKKNNGVADVALVFLLLTLNILQNFF